MDWEDVQPSSAKPAVVGEPLNDFSIEELRDRITALKSEIVRVEVEMKAKEVQGAAAAKLFKG